MTKGKKFTPDDPAQSERFVEAARKEGIEKVGKGFEKAMGKLAPAMKPASGKPKRG